MLVNYRRVPRPSVGSAGPGTVIDNSEHKQVPGQDPGTNFSPSSPRPVLRRAMTSQGVPASKHEKERSIEHAATDHDTELPVVPLNINPHIIPGWMLRGRRDSNRGSQLRRLQQHDRGLASSPDLPRARIATASKSNTPSHRPDAPKVFVPKECDHDIDYTDSTTPANSPSSKSVSALQRLVAHRCLDPPPIQVRNKSGAMTDYESRTPIRFGPRQQDPSTLSATLSLNAVCPSVFGGKGSTTVHTRFKDHVFNAIFRQWNRRRGEVDSGDEDDHAEADGEDDDGGIQHRIRRARTRRRGVKHCNGASAAGAVRRLMTDEGSEVVAADNGLRRVQSEGLVASPAKFSMPLEEERGTSCGPSGRGKSVLRGRSGSLDIFDFDLHPKEPRAGSPSDHRRSRSRSLGMPISRPMVSAGPTFPKNLSEETRHPLESHSSGTSMATRQEHFILMEDLTGRLKRSCVLDLKMGTRQYGIDATAAKKKSQRKKCDRTTSRTLGVRICGMQVST